MIRIFLLLFITLSSLSWVNSQSSVIDSLKRSYASASEDSIKVVILTELMSGYFSRDPDSIKFYADQLAKFQNIPDLPHVKSYVSNGYGVYYFYKGNYDSTLYYFNYIYERAKEDQNEQGMASALNNIGLVYSNQGKFQDALKIYLESLAIQERINESGLKSVLTNIGGLYVELKNYEKAIDIYYRKRSYVHEPLDMARFYQDLGLCFFKSGQMDSALFYYNLGWNISLDSGFQLQAALIGKAKGSYFMENNQTDSARWYYDYSINYLKTTELRVETARSLLALGELAFSSKNYEESLKFHNESLLIFRELGMPHEVAYVLDKIAINLKILGRYLEAYDALSEAKTVDDSLFSQLNSDALSEMQVKYETDKKEQELALQAAQLSGQEILLGKQKLLRNIAIGGAILLGLIAIVIYWIKSHSNKEISIKNEQLGSALEERETLIKEIHHRVKNNLQIISSLLYLQSDESENQSVNKLLEEGQGRVRSMALIHQKLYENEDLKSIPFEEYLNELISEIRKSFGDKAESIHLEVNADGIFFDVDTAVPLGLIVNELSTNAFKYAFSKQQLGNFLKVFVKEEAGNTYYMSVSDNGIGISDKVLHSSGPKSLGLKLTRMLSEQL